MSYFANDSQEGEQGGWSYTWVVEGTWNCDHFRVFPELKQTCFSHNSREAQGYYFWSMYILGLPCHEHYPIGWGHHLRVSTTPTHPEHRSTLVSAPADVNGDPMWNWRAGWFQHTQDRKHLFLHADPLPQRWKSRVLPLIPVATLFYMVNPTTHKLPCERLLPTVWVWTGVGGAPIMHLKWYTSRDVAICMTSMSHPFQQPLHSPA